MEVCLILIPNHKQTEAKTFLYPDRMSICVYICVHVCPLGPCKWLDVDRLLYNYQRCFILVQILTVHNMEKIKEFSKVQRL